MKRVLALLTTLLSSAALFATDPVSAQFKLTTTIPVEPHQFELYDGNAPAGEEALVSITKDGDYDTLSIYVISGNYLDDQTYTMKVMDTDFVGSNPNNTATVETKLKLADGSIAKEPENGLQGEVKKDMTVPGGKITKPTPVADTQINISWKGRKDLPADVYTDTITVTITANT